VFSSAYFRTVLAQAAANYFLPRTGPSTHGKAGEQARMRIRRVQPAQPARHHLRLAKLHGTQATVDFREPLAADLAGRVVLTIGSLGPRPMATATASTTRGATCSGVTKLML
jgi:hypothetical protein